MAIKFYEHPEYKEYSADWKLYRDLYEGDRSALRQGTILWYHDFERNNQNVDAQRLRASREERTRYVNRMETIVSRYVSLVFKESPAKDQGVIDLFDDNIHAVTAEGESLDNFLKNCVATNYFLFGKVGVRTDSFAVEVANREQEQAAGQRPFWEEIEPLDLKDWQYLPNGKGLQFVRYEYVQVEARQSATEKPQEVLYTELLQLTGLSQVEAMKYKQVKAADGAAEWVLVSSTILTGLTAIPFKILGEGESWVKDSAQIILALYNKESSRDNILYYQAYQRLFIIGVNDEQHKRQLSEYSIGFLPDGASVQAIEPGSITSLSEAIAQDKDELLKVAFNNTRNIAAESKVAEAADTQQAGKEGLVSLILAHIETIETFANQIIADYAAYKGIKDFQGRVTFSRDIKVEDIDKEIQTYAALRDDINQVPLWKKAFLKKVAASQNLGQIEEINQAIDAVSTTAPSVLGGGVGQRLLANFGGVGGE